MHHRLLAACLISLALLPASGCSKDALDQAAPPPSPEAAARGPETTRPKRLPGPNGHGGVASGGAGAPSMLGPAAKPAGM